MGQRGARRLKGRRPAVADVWAQRPRLPERRDVNAHYNRINLCTPSITNR